MCGRYGLYDLSDNELLQGNKGYHFEPNYNAAPTQSMPVITENVGQHHLTVMQWGIGRRIGPETEKNIFNKRSEKAFDRFWGKAVRTHRCLVPANGFYEWEKTDTGKQPYWIHDPGETLIYFAGIYDIDSAGNAHFSIMTTNANLEMQKLHNRMPVILQKDEQTIWLNESDDVIDVLPDLLKPLPNDSLRMFEVSQDVNTVKNNNGELIKATNSQ